MISINIDNHHLCISIDFDSQGAICFHEILLHVLNYETGKLIPCIISIDGKLTESNFYIKYAMGDEFPKNRDLLFNGNDIQSFFDREDLENLASLVAGYIKTSRSYPEFTELLCNGKMYDVYVFLNRKII